MFNSRPLTQAGILSIIPVLAFVVLHCSLLPPFDSNLLNKDPVTNTPLLTTVDGLYYARLSEDLLKGQYRVLDPMRPAPRPVPVPAIVNVSAFLSTNTGLPLETVAFYLPPVFAILSIPLMWAWACRAFPDHCWAPVIVSTAFSINYAWFTRTAFGKFDTDGLNQVLFWAIGFFLYNFMKMRGCTRYYSLALAAASILLLTYWWIPVGLPLGMLFVLLFSCTIFSPAPKFDKYLKTTILCLAFVGLAIILTAAFTEILPRKLSNLVTPYLSHLTLVRGNDGSIFPAMGKTIAELRTLGVAESIKWVAGSAYVAPFALLGLIALCLKSSGLIFLLVIPTALFAMLAADALRFLLFLAPGFAFGVAGFAIHICFPLILSIFKSRMVAHAATLITSIGLIAPGFVHCMNYQLRPSFNANVVNLARSIDTTAGPNAVMWNWWGPGYMLEYYGKRRTFIDGGLQEPERSWVAAVPLASHDYVFARNWIRFFARNNMGVQAMARRLKSTQEAIQFLQEALRDESRLGFVLQEYGLSKDERNWQKFLFPDVETYLVLLSDMLTHGSWLPIGQHIPGKTGPISQHPFFAVPNDSLRFNTTKGLLLLPDDQALPVSRVYTVTPDELRHDRFNQQGIVIVGARGTDYIIYMNENHLNTLALNLLFVHPGNTPGFRMISYNPFVGGVWKVD